MVYGDVSLQVKSFDDGLARWHLQLVIVAHIGGLGVRHDLCHHDGAFKPILDGLHMKGLKQYQHFL